MGLLAAYAIVNAVLYSMLLPLWEGFDEPFHFGYVQALGNEAGFPDPRSARLSEEVAHSLRLAPGSPSVQRNLPEVMTYSRFFALTSPDRAARRRELSGIDPALRWQPSKLLNYEGLQAPLAYAILAAPERLLSASSLLTRTLILRILCATAGSLLLFAGIVRLVQQLELPRPYSEILGFCVFSSQMLWATIAHVANDWLAIPLALWFLVLTLDYYERPAISRAVRCAVMLSLGLLTKAYFLAFLPMFAVIFLIRRRARDGMAGALILICMAVPWYYRNLVRYGTISGMQEVREGIHPADAISAIRIGHIFPALNLYLRQALWTGNNTFRSFSMVTLGALVLVWLIGLVLWIPPKRHPREWIVVAYASLFIGALAYDGAIAFVASHGETNSPGAWYTQVLLTPMLAIALLGMSRWRRLGRAAAGPIVFLFGYILMATYWEKLIPMYSGLEDRMSLRLTLAAYLHAPERFAALGDASLGPPGLIFAGAFLVTGLAVTQMVILLRKLAGDGPAGPKTDRRAFHTQHRGPLPGISIGAKVMALTDEQVADWERRWGAGKVERFELAGGAGKAWTKAEQVAATDATRLLTQDDPPPQTVYRVDAKPAEPLLVKVRLRYSPGSAR